MSRLSGTVSGVGLDGENITKLSKTRSLMIDVPKLTLDKGKISINRNFISVNRQSCLN